jgi:phosphatidylethanolamine/phosphatidyl-N-methylethanolamine N-methyltransferase
MNLPVEPAQPRWTLLRQWLKNPLRTAALLPSSAELGAAMVAELPPGTQRLIELGGGTGAITEALLKAGIPAAGMLVVELNEELHAHLQSRFPGVTIAEGDARDLREIAWRSRFLDAGTVDAVVSSLGLLSMPRDTQRAILTAAFACLGEAGRFIQFTYGPQAPVAEEVVRSLRLSVRRGDFILRNVPPATVYVYTRTASGDA